MAKDIAAGTSQEIIQLNREIELLKNELLVQGELLERERLDRKTETDHLKLEVRTLKKLIDQGTPGFLAKFQSLYASERENYDPELEKSAS
jgi:hypothetical protein